jgi:hypothetical protein
MPTYGKPHFSTTYVLFGIPQYGHLYHLRVALLEPSSPIVELAIQAGELYGWLKRHGYDLNATSVSEGEDVILAHVTASCIAELGLISEPLLEGSFGTLASGALPLPRLSLPPESKG